MTDLYLFVCFRFGVCYAAFGWVLQLDCFNSGVTGLIFRAANLSFWVVLPFAAYLVVMLIVHSVLLGSGYI